MHMRGAAATASDVWHGNLTLLGAGCYLLAMGFGAAAFRGRFRWYSIGTMLTLSAFGALAGIDIPRIGASLPTPWVGVWERVNIYATMLWIAALAAALLRGGPERTG